MSRVEISSLYSKFLFIESLYLRRGCLNKGIAQIYDKQTFL